MIVNYASSSVNKLKASLNDDTRVIIYDPHMFIVQDTGVRDRIHDSTVSSKLTNGPNKLECNITLG
jgi:hypothetical protein